MIVGLDLDGVLYNFGDSVKRFLEETDRGHLWKSGPTPTPFWDFYKDWGWTNDQFVEMCNEGVDAGVIFHGRPRPHAVDAVWKIKNDGHALVVITDRQFGTTPKASHDATIEWWNYCGFPSYDKIVFSADKTVVKTDIFVEDKLSNYDAITKAGTECWLINRAWNIVDDGDSRNRINGIEEFPEKVRTCLITNILV